MSRRDCASIWSSDKLIVGKSGRDSCDVSAREEVSSAFKSFCDMAPGLLDASWPWFKTRNHFEPRPYSFLSPFLPRIFAPGLNVWLQRGFFIRSSQGHPMGIVQLYP